MYSERMKRQIELWEATQEWAGKNPQVYGKFVELALAKCARREKFSIHALTEVIRWDASVVFDDGDFKIPNAYRRYIALRMMVQHPNIEHYCTTKRGDVEIPETLLGKWRTKTIDDAVSDPALDDLDSILDLL